MSNKLPRDLSGRDVGRILESIGFKSDRRNDGHFTYTLGSNTTTVPDHRKGVKTGTLNEIIKQAGLSRKDFMDAYRKWK
ncbi:MAG: type II toxin-antitoxin system HicA family toxin [Alphaproteobacteria bacterium]|nr:type II toxin-antitoxin system HicA family toxin [Alphaproteobacteria bacterium]